jgi:hypothetical protein
LLFLAATLCAACASPSQRIERIAAAGGAQRQVFAGTSFKHLTYFKPGGHGAAELHVYLDHDGLPWLDSSRVAADPSPRNPLALRLMLQDPAPSLYLGRPCHYGVDGQPPCQPLLWTHARYNEEVVASLHAALRRFLREHAFTRVALIGYSGGGTLAALLAEREPRVDALITVAGNLDVAAWARLHDYSPLAGSLDPATRPALAPSIRQIHLVGSGDENVVPALTRQYAASRPAARIVEAAGYGHVCCWVENWPRLLGEIFAVR